jgi:hypothetical protein
MTMPAALKHDLTGQTFGWLTVLRRSGAERSKTLWLCRCLCGAVKPVSTGDLLRANVKSCGCRAATIRRARTNEGSSMALAIRFGEAVNKGLDYDANEADRERIRATGRRKRKNRAGEKREENRGEVKPSGADGA